MKNYRVFLWLLSLLPLLVCFESSAYAQDGPKIHRPPTPTCKVNVYIQDNKNEYRTVISVYLEDGSPTLLVPRFLSSQRYQLRLDVGTNYIVKLRGKYPATPDQRPVSCRPGPKTLVLPFKITAT